MQHQAVRAKCVCPDYLVSVLFHAKVSTTMFHKHVRLLKGLWVQQEIQSLPGCQLTLQNKTPLCVTTCMPVKNYNDKSTATTVVMHLRSLGVLGHWGLYYVSLIGLFCDNCKKKIELISAWCLQGCSRALTIRKTRVSKTGHGRHKCWL